MRGVEIDLRGGETGLREIETREKEERAEMTDAERRELNQYKSSLVCLDTELTDLPRDSTGAEAGGLLRTAVGEVESRGTAQVSHTGAGKEGTAVRRAARQRIKTEMQALLRTAITIARKKPGFDENFKTPRSNNDQKLLASAKAAHEAAIQNKADFDKLGITAERLERFQAAIADFTVALGATSGANASRGAAVAGIDQWFDRAEDAFEDLDTYVRNFYEDNPQKLAAWRIASHRERAPKSKLKLPTA